MQFTFYNPHTSAFSMDVSFPNCTIQLAIALPQSVGQPRTKYNWDQNLRADFSLTPSECAKIHNNFDALCNGTYRNPDPKIDSKYAGILSFTHFPPSMDGQSGTQPSRFLIYRGSRDGKPIDSLTIKMIPSNKEGNYFYGFRLDELIIFHHFVRNGFENLPFLSSFWGEYGAISRLERKEAYTRGQKSGSDSSRGSGAGSSGGVDTFPSDSPGGPEKQTGSNPFDSAGGFDQKTVIGPGDDLPF